ncbi:hypothetical protein JOM56_006991 [Amanita muscaria]
MKELTRHDDGRILCECRKCYQICRDGVYLIPRTYRNHKKYRDLDPDEEELEHRAARAAFFKKWGKPNTSSASSSSSQMHTRRRKKKSKAAHKTTVPPLPLDEDMSADAEIQYMDDRDDLDVLIYGDASTGDALTPGSASTQGEGLMGDAPMQGDVPTQGDASVGGVQDEEEAPVDPLSARRTCDESDEEDSEEDLASARGAT